MARKVTHAPDGGAIPGPLCEEPTGDVSTFENDVDCPECLDRLEMSEKNFDRLARPLRNLRAFRSRGRSDRRPVKVRLSRRT